MATGTLKSSIARALIPGQKFTFENFLKNADGKSWLCYTHYSFFYSYPEFGKKWLNHKDCQYHRVNTCCNCCRKKADRNYAGIGTFYAYKSKIRKNRIVLFCKSCRDWRDTKEFNYTSAALPINNLQYQLF